MLFQVAKLLMVGVAMKFGTDDQTVDGFIREKLGVDSVGYLSVEGMLGVLSRPAESYCTACWTGDYPVRIPEGMSKKSCGEMLPLIEG